jgi:hypothetical protein
MAVNRFVNTTHQMPICPQCGYDLRGRFEAHKCPECGFEYAEDTVLLVARHSAPPMMPLMIIHAIAMLVIPINMFFVGLPLSQVMAWLGILFGLSAIYVLIRMLFAVGPVQRVYVADARGYCQARVGKALRFTPWSRVDNVIQYMTLLKGFRSFSGSGDAPPLWSLTTYRPGMMGTRRGKTAAPMDRHLTANSLPFSYCAQREVAHAALAAIRAHMEAGHRAESESM